MYQKLLSPNGRIMKRDAIQDIKCSHIIWESFFFFLIQMCGMKNDEKNLVYLCRSQFVGAIEGAVGDGGWCSDKEAARKCSSFRLAAKEKQSTVSFTF